MKFIQINDSLNYLEYFNEVRDAFVNSPKFSMAELFSSFEKLLGLDYHEQY
jgi:hypothetical protein